MPNLSLLSHLSQTAGLQCLSVMLGSTYLCDIVSPLPFSQSPLKKMAWDISEDAEFPWDTRHHRMRSSIVRLSNVQRLFSSMTNVRYLTAQEAQRIDDELMGAKGAFSLDQLMELAGLACAQTLATVYDKKQFSKVLVCCGPGNQGGDGLVAARHLAMFGYEPTIYLPKPGSKEIYKRLHQQCENCQVPTISTLEELKDHLDGGKSQCILDAVFGFSFRPPLRPPFDEVLPLLSNAKLPTVSVDIPSGWDVEKGPIDLPNADGRSVSTGLDPDVHISLTAPKLGVQAFKGRHFLGGRFVPKELAERFQLSLPEYPGTSQIVEL